MESRTIEIEVLEKQQCFALQPETTKILKVLLCNTFKIFVVV
ncbi:hypothetical protein APA_2560 [Pseudanabaena sp. lw0831]|nr:hypothetical protein APA_2560 [Pseudanabaena sp. lw0831]